MTGFELLLMRHGEAESFAAGGDSDRRLTEFGCETAHLIGRALAVMDLTWQAAVSSPFVRAQQTLDLVVDAMGEVVGQAATNPMLVPGAPPTETIAMLASYAVSEDATRLLAVGHNPNITATLGQLVVGDAGVYFSVATGDLAHLWIDLTHQDPRAAVLGFYPSRVLRNLAGS